MPDKPTQLVLDGLRRAAADPAGVALHGAMSAAGLFAPNASGRQAARRARDEGFLRILRTDTSGKAPVEYCAITEKGLAYLLSQVGPRQVLEDLVRALEARQEQAGELLAAARHMQSGLDALKATAETALNQLGQPQRTPAPPQNGSETWPAAVLSHLARRHESGASGDCPLPELYRAAVEASPGLTIGHFHDGLRRLHDAGQIYLHPWTGPLYALPEPPCALLVGHEVAYYASCRDGERS